MIAMTQEQQPIAPTLRQLAEAVKDWSNDNQAWLKPDCEDGIAVLGGIIDGEEYPIAEFDADTYGTDGESIKLAQFYAAASPTVVLDLLDHLADLEAQLAAQLAWMSIDTAPKDGTLILVKSAHDDEFPAVCYWFPLINDWSLTRTGLYAVDELVDPAPTLWTHIPASATAPPQE